MQEFRDIEHPDITRARASGYGDGRADRMLHCPECGEECDTVYVDRYGEAAGCGNCISIYDADTAAAKGYIHEEA